MSRGDLQIGRFEVTRAQFHSFLHSACLDKDDKLFPAPGTGNFPANGVTLDQAKQYVEWLSRVTGDGKEPRYRIPYEDEVKELYEHREGENTLDYWAGYTPNPENATSLRAAAKKLIGDVPLLKGSRQFPRTRQR